jgi:hypothetical protein
MVAVASLLLGLTAGGLGGAVAGAAVVRTGARLVSYVAGPRAR